MTLRYPKDITDSVEELLKLLLRSEEIPFRTMDKSLRSLRPAPQGGLDHYAGALKLRLKQSILSNNSSASANGFVSTSGPIAVAAFESACDKLRRCNPHIMNSMLTVLEPLSFPRASTGCFQLPQVTQMAKELNNSRALHPLAAVPVVGKVVEPTGVPDIDRTNNDNNLSKHFNSNLSSTVRVPSLSDNAKADALVWVEPYVEDLLLRDLLFVFQGIPGQHIKFDNRSEQYVIDPALHVSAPAADVVYCLCELGWLYGRVHAYLARVERESRGVVVQSFCFALQAELHDYYRLLSVLEKDMATRTAALDQVGAPSRDIASGNSAAGSAAATPPSEGTSGLTLLRLRAWMQEPLERMLLLARLVDSVGPLTGGALISRLHGHKHYGNNSIRAIVERVMNTVCTPVYDMLSRWMLHGELHDPYEEFFVGYRAGVTAANVWHDGYYLRMKMLPAFLAPALAHKVLLIGKTINFMRLAQSLMAPSAALASASSAGRRTADEKAIGDLQENAITGDNDKFLSNSAAAVAVAASAMESVMVYGREEQLAESILRVSADTDSRLLKLVETQYHIQAHLFALKQFLLLGQGDFIVGLMDLVGPELRKRASQLYRHNLTGMLEGALRSSNAQYMSPAVLDRLGVKLLEASPGDSGWEVFTLDYLIEPPLSAVVHKKAMVQYRTAFHMLWRLKRVEWMLSSGWKRVLLLTHSRGAFEGLTRLKAVLHRCSLNRSRMLHVVTTFCTYLMFEVLEVEWRTMQDRIENQCHSLEDLISAHDSYLSAIVERALLGAHDDELNAQLQRMLQSVLNFCALEETLIADAVSALARKRARTAAALDSSVTSSSSTRRTSGAAVDWQTEVGTEDPNSYDGVPAVVVQRLDGAVRDYSQQFDAFMAMLSSHSSNGQAPDHRASTRHIARFLALRLDFNGYHALAKAEGKTGVLLGTPPVHAEGNGANTILESRAAKAGAAKTRLSFSKAELS